jgi:hypothetical protein
MSTADRTKLDRQYRSAQAQKRYSSPTSAPKRLSAPVSTEIKKPNLLAQVYNALLSIPTPAPAGVGVPSRTNNPLNQTVEPVRVAGRRAVGDITAIPGVGKPSASPTATDIKQGNYLGPGLDYLNLALTAVPAAKGASAVTRTAKDVANKGMAKAYENFLVKQYERARAIPVRPNDMSPELDEALSAWATKQGVENTGPEMMAQGVQNRAGIEAMRRNRFAPSPTISLSDENLAQVLDTGSYGTMFDVGQATRSSDYDLWRNANEAILYGISGNETRPIYGFLRRPGDPYTAADYGKTYTSLGRGVLDPRVTTNDNFFIQIKPNRKMTSAPSDSFRVENPSSVKPLLSSDQPAVQGYREVQMWGDSIPTSDIQSAELVFSSPKSLFRTLLQDNETPLKETLQQYIGKIDGLLGTKKPSVYGDAAESVLSKLQKANIPTSVTVKRDFGLSPSVSASADVEKVLMSLREEAVALLKQLDEQGEQVLRQSVQSEMASLFLDPQQNYMASLMRQGEMQRAGRVFAETHAGANANPFFPGSYINYFDPIKNQFKTVSDVKAFFQGAGKTQVDDVMPEIVFDLLKSNTNGVVKTLTSRYNPSELAERLKMMEGGDWNPMFISELEQARMYLGSNQPYQEIIQKLFDGLPPAIRQEIQEHWKRLEGLIG